MTDASASGNDYLSYFCLAVLSVCLGATFFFQSYALQDMSPPVAGALRILFCAAVLVPAAVVSGQKLPRTPSMWSWAALIGLLGLFLPFNLTIWAQQYVDTSVIAVIYAVIPLIVLFLSRLLLGVLITARKWFGVLLGSMGLVALALPESEGHLLDGDFLAKLAILGSTVMLAGAGIAIRKMPPLPPLAAMAAASIVSTLLSLPILAYSAPAIELKPLSLGAIIAAGVFSTAIGQTLRFFLVRRRGPVFIAPVAYLAAFVSTVLGVAFLNEPITATLVFGFVIILAGLMIAQDGSGKMASI